MESICKTLCQKEYWIIDVLPKQVPENCGGQYFAVERRLRSHPHIDGIFRRFAAVLLKLYCYRPIALSVNGNGWTDQPDPDELAARIGACAGGPDSLRLLIGADAGLLVLNGDDAYMTLYHPDPDLLALIRALARSEGLFVWGPLGIQE